MASPQPSPTTAIPPASPATLSSKTDRLTSREASAARRNALRAFYKLSAEPASSTASSSSSSSSTAQTITGTTLTTDSSALASPASPTTPLESVPEGTTLSDQSGASGANDPSEIVAGLYTAYEKYVAGQPESSPETKKTEVNGVYVQPIDTFVRDLIARHDLKTLLQIENELVAEIRTLDSEQKALVYNNYAKLTAAGTALHGVSREPMAETTEEDGGGEIELGKEEDEDEDKELSKLAGKNVREKIEQVVKGLGDIRAEALKVAGEEIVPPLNPEEESPLVQTAKWLVRVPNDLPIAVASVLARPANDPERAKLLARAAAVKARALTALDHLISNSGPGLQFAFDKDELGGLRKKIESISIS
ncbi:uncharacterized protein SAPINGB_P005169 [Magnusiomyces paraingens]|uniref:Vacuolar protein sorting-associated protein 51 homolog n=1 Tax=Magnusiomyces paraingens TaxID=2606893 RepID=A0A5E8C5V6_9ASCO|nr:uncharacterized protein SAPINGB_P005169 [Saprochaete ingens]VVT56596.1 unnamed protein product [Saprochaete ingens]